MISHYFKLAKKTLLKNKYYTFINVFGLVCGMLSGLVIAKYVGGSMNFDSFHVNKDRIYSIVQKESIEGNPQKESKSTYLGAAELITQYPEVISMSRYNQQVASVVQTDGAKGGRVSFVENKIFAADSGFLKIFTFPLITGDSATALSRINSVVLTNSTSKRYFGETNPIGKILTIRVPWGEETDYEITGVAEDTPQQSRFKFDFLVTQSPVDPIEYWTVPDYSIFVLLRSAEASAGLGTKLESALDNVAQLKATNRKAVMSLESVSDVKLTNTEYLLIAIGIFIVVISWVNYVNQIIAQSYLRVKEVGILRVMGSTRANLETQFILESGLICVTSLILVVVIYIFFEPYLQTLTNGHLLPLIEDPTLVNLGFLGIFVIGIATAAFIPTVILFSQNFATTLRNGFGSKIQSLGLRKVLMITQFSISTVLMIGIFVVSGQLEYMRERDKGFDMEGVLVLKDPMSKWKIKRETLNLFKDKCAKLPFVSEITSSTTVPGEEYRHETYLSFQNDDKKTLVHLNGVDDHFFNLYNVQFVSGHGFVPEARWKNKKSIVLSTSAAKGLGIFDFNGVMDTKIVDHESGEVYDLIGIVRDYHQTSLKNEIKPMAFHFNDVMGHFSLKTYPAAVNGRELESRISAIKLVWDEVYQDAPFDYFFLEDRFIAQDAEDQYFGKLFTYFTFLSIIISCLGLFGLSLLISTKRQREIGVRKSFGATSGNILYIFLKGYMGSLLISVLIGGPLAYVLMNIWLRNFSYRIEIGILPISLAVLSLTLIFLITVSYHTLKSSLANPVKILRD